VQNILNKSCLSSILFLLLVFIPSFLPFAHLIADDEPFTYPSNRGETGLMETPTARVMEKNSYRVGISQIDPYRSYYITMSILDRLEITGRVTEVLGVKASPQDPNWRGYGNYKDKAIDFKYQFLREGKYAPALALGIMDPHGTRLYASQYIVASKQIYPFDFTIGFGNGRFGKRPLASQGEGFKIELFQTPKDWLKDSQFFGGIQWAISDKYALMIEYNPIRYHRQTQDPAQKKYFKEPVSSHFNYGLRWKPFTWAEIDLSYQRGDQIGINLSTAFHIGRPLIPIYDHPYREKKEDMASPLSKRIAKALHESGFSNIGVIEDRQELWIEAQNDRYYYNTKAIGVIVQILSRIVPQHTGNIHITITDNRIPLFTFTTSRIDITEFSREKITANEFFFLSRIDTSVAESSEVPLKHEKLFGYGIRPSFQTFLNDPSGFFKYRLGVAVWGSYHPWKGSSFIAGLEGYPLNNISTTNEPLSIPVRSDITLYKKKNITLGRLMFDQIYKGKNEIYGRIAGGLLEIQYAGFDGECAMPFFGGRFLVGLSGSLVKKRDPDNVLKFKDDIKSWYKTAFLNSRINIPKHEVSIDIKAGRFLAGDKGIKVTVSKFIHGVIISAWYSFTNTSVFSDRFNRGYRDKGVSLTIPLRLFKGADSKTAYSYSLSPWTRDVAQDIEHHNNLFDFMGRNTKIFIDKDREDVFK